MTSRLRVLGLRVALLCGLAPTVLAAAPAAAARPDLPFVLLASFDQAFARVYGAAEREVERLEATRPPRPSRPDVFAMLRALEGKIAAACDAASTRLDVELVVAGALPPRRRAAVLGCIERHLDEARRALVRASDPGERAEYRATCERLRDVRRRIG